jgi:M6 family metalloprotease-like protein
MSVLLIGTFACCRTMSWLGRNLCYLVGLNIAFSLQCYGTLPGFPRQQPKENPPSGQSFQQWTQRQRVATVAFQRAPGANIGVVQSSQPVRIPFFVISFKDSPPDLVQDKLAVIAKLKERIFGSATNPSDSLQGYYNQLFSGKLSFFDPGDLIPLELEGSIKDYFADRFNPKRKLFQSLKQALSHTQVPLEVYNNKQLNGESNATTSDELRDLLDLAVIFVLGTSDDVWPQRWWYEWTGDNGIQIVFRAGPALPLIDPISRKIVRLSNYCVAPVFGSATEHEVISYNFLAHEMLHAFGLPDLYDRTDNSAGCGGWCCMGYGLYGGVNSVAHPWQPHFNLRPVWPSAWCRQFLGVDGRGTRLWRVPAEGDAELVSPLNGEGKTFYRIDLPGRTLPLTNRPQYQRYLLVEFRGPRLQKNGVFDWDAQLPAAGFLIWEVSEDVGRFDLSSTQAVDNAFWPCAYHSKGQNDDEDNPLVGLWHPDAQALRNLDKSAILQKEHLWTRDDQVFKHPDGVVLSHFRRNGKIGSFHYRIEVSSVSPAPTPVTIASVPQSLVAQPQPSATVSEATGEPKALVAGKLTSQVSGGLKNVFAAYPKFDHAITVQDNQVKSIELPASVSSKQAFTKDVSAQLSLFNGEALGDSRAQIISATPAPRGTPSKASMANLYKGTTAIANRVGVKIGDQIVPVDNSHIDVQHKETDPGRVTYFVSNPVRLPQLPKNLSTPVSREAVTKFLQERFRDAIPKDIAVELVLENGTGKLKWQCRIPTVPTSGPVTIEIDAEDPAGLTDKTAVVVK